MKAFVICCHPESLQNELYCFLEKKENRDVTIVKVVQSDYQAVDGYGGTETEICMTIFYEN